MTNQTRLLVSGIVVASLFLALFSRLFFLQVVEGSELAAAAEANQVRTVIEEAPRGRILDREGEVLVSNRETDAIVVEREAVADDPNLLPNLAAFLDTTVEALEARINDEGSSPYRPAVVADDVDKSVIASMRERQNEFPGVQATTLVERWYPDGPIAAHVVGYTGEINDTELDELGDNGYQLGDEIGKAGIEAALEDELRGEPGITRIEVDSSGRAVEVLSRTAPVPGNDVKLAIDKQTQQAAEAALSEGMEAVQSRPGAVTSDFGTSGGSVYATDPRSGDVLALASWPTYDPAEFADGISADRYNELVDIEGKRPLSNRAVQGTYAPGSTFKLVTAMAALESGARAPDEYISDGGAFYLGGQRFQNAQGRAYGPVNMERSLTVSSDVYYYQLGAQFWSNREENGNVIQDAARKLGFGEPHGIVIGSEAEGRIPSPESRREMHEQYPEAFPEGNWYAGDNVNLSIGQGDTLVTPLQIADSYAAFANGGTVNRPRLVLEVLDHNGAPIRKVDPSVHSSFDLQPQIKEPIERGLVGAVSNPQGTAYNAFESFDLEAFPVAGKTGTAQVNNKNDTALFAAYGPTTDPRIAISVVLEQGGFGSQSAAPVARKTLAGFAGQEQATEQVVELEEGID